MEKMNSFYRNKKILVTGATGFKGSWLCCWLLHMGAKVYGTGYSPNQNKNLFYKLKLNKKIKLGIFDIRDKKKLDKFVLKSKPSIIFHLAAQSRVQPSFKNPEESLRVNVLGTSKLLEWSRINNTKIIYAGSSSRHHSPSDSPYAMTKYLGEEICKLYRKSFKVNVQIARFYNVYGPFQLTEGGYTTLIGKWLNNIENNSV